MPHLVTGATGFVGSALVLELLLQTDEPIIGVVRPTSEETPTQRLHRVLQDLIVGYRQPTGLLEAIAERVSAVAGDLEDPYCGVSERASLTGAEVWHCAASLQYQDRHREKIDRANVGGTAHALDLAQSIDCRHVNMISTAYVAGAQSGLITPQPGDLRLVNNLYERSKVAAEQLVRSSGLDYRIMRPGVVIGHSVTRHSTSTDGLYGFLRSLRKFRGVLDRTQPGLSERLEVRVIAETEGPLDLVPVDHVAADAVALSLSDAPQGHYHLTNCTPPLIGESITKCFEAVGLRAPLFVASAEEFSSTDHKLRERLDFYNSYIVNAKSFDRSTVVAAVGDRAAPGMMLGPEVLDGFCRRYLEAFDAARSRLPVAR